MADIIELDMVTSLDIPPSRVLRGAREAKLTNLVVVGFDKDGDFYFAANKADGANTLWLLELAKKKILEIGDPK